MGPTFRLNTHPFPALPAFTPFPPFPPFPPSKTARQTHFTVNLSYENNRPTFAACKNKQLPVDTFFLSPLPSIVCFCSMGALFFAPPFYSPSPICPISQHATLVNHGAAVTWPHAHDAGRRRGPACGRIFFASLPSPSITSTCPPRPSITCT